MAQTEAMLHLRPTSERLIFEIETETHWPNPVLSSLANSGLLWTGQSGVKMARSSSWVAPSYWLTDTNRYGEDLGFDTETGPS